MMSDRHWQRFKDWRVFKVFILRKCTSDTCAATISAISSYVFPVAVNASVRVDSPENKVQKTPMIRQSLSINIWTVNMIWKHFNKQSCSFLLWYPLVLKTDDRFWNAFPICRYSFCNAVGLKTEFLYLGQITK